MALPPPPAPFIETKQIPTTTQLQVDGSDINIFTFYDPDIWPNIVEVFIAEIVGMLDGVPYIEGELIVAMNNYPLQISCEINSDGEFIIWTPPGNEAEHYSINSDGDLIFTE